MSELTENLPGFIGYELRDLKALSGRRDWKQFAGLFVSEDLKLVEPFVEKSTGLVEDRIKYRKLMGEESGIPADVAKFVEGERWLNYALSVLANPWMAKNGYLAEVTPEIGQKVVKDFLVDGHSETLEIIMGDRQLKSLGFLPEGFGRGEINAAFGRGYSQRKEEEELRGRAYTELANFFEEPNLCGEQSVVFEGLLTTLFGKMFDPPSRGNAPAKASYFLKLVTDHPDVAQYAGDVYRALVQEAILTQVVHGVKNGMNKLNPRNFVQATDSLIQTLGGSEVFGPDVADHVLATLYRFKTSKGGDIPVDAYGHKWTYAGNKGEHIIPPAQFKETLLG